MVMSKPQVVCLCGSTRFKDEFVAANLRETLQGNIVLTIGCDMKTDAELFGHMTEDELHTVKHRLDLLHLEKIRMAHRVLILNKGGYIGESTARELWFAQSLHKRIDYLEPEHRVAAEAKAELFQHKWETEGDAVVAALAVRSLHGD